MGNLSNILGGSFTPPAEAIPKSPEAQLIEAMLDAGLTPPAQVHLDGKIHRFCSSGKKGDSGWYVVFSDGVPAGQFGDWRTGVTVSFRADIGRPLTAIEEMANTRRMAEAKAMREAEEKRKHEAAANTVEIIWSNGIHAGEDHPYLQRKGISPNGARVTGDGRLMVPLYNEDGDLTSLQYISGDGDKKYHAGGETGGCYWSLGVPSDRIYIAEGFATAATIYQVTGQHTVIAYSASNLVPVTKSIREKFGPLQDIVIVADNDASGTGQKYADQASAKYGAKVILPPTEGDANDYAQAGGDLDALLNPPNDEWLIAADDFSSQPAPVKWLVKDWIQEEALIMVHGPSGAGKSFLTLDWALRMAAGMTDWAGKKVKPCNVLYLAGEGHAGLRGRIAAFKQHHGIKNLNMWLSKSGCDINTPEGYRQVVEHIRAMKIKPDIIIIDTVHRFYHGDENSSQDVKTMLEACAALMREFSASVLLVHHTGVSEEAQHRARGSSAWRGALEIEISVVPLQSDSGTSFRIVQRKAKDSELAITLTGNLKRVEIKGWFDEDGDPVTSAVVEVEENTPDEQGAKLGVVSAKIKNLENAWLKSGKEIDENGNPIVSRSALADYLQEINLYKTPASLKQALKPSSEHGFIAPLISAEIIQLKTNSRGEVSDIIIVNESLVSSLLLQRNFGS